MHATAKGNKEMVKMLIKEGANVTINDNYNIKIARKKGYKEIEKMLINAGADKNAIK